MVKVLYKKHREEMNDVYWQKLKARVVAIIKLCLDDDVMYHVIDEESSAIVLEKN
jgi:hypothetical protein